MIPADVRRAIFAALDRSDRRGPKEPASLRGCLYRVAIKHGQPITETVDHYIDILIEEFYADCPAPER